MKRIKTTIASILTILTEYVPQNSNLKWR